MVNIVITERRDVPMSEFIEHDGLGMPEEMRKVTLSWHKWELKVVFRDHHAIRISGVNISDAIKKGWTHTNSAHDVVAYSFKPRLTGETTQ